MKFLNILSLLLVALVALTSAQTCPGAPRNSTCVGPRNVGRGGAGCVARNMWHYETTARQCRQFRYLGCGGNYNRWCTLAACQQRCRRP